MKETHKSTLKDYEVEFNGFKFVVEEITDNKNISYEVFISSDLKNQVIKRFKELESKV